MHHIIVEDSCAVCQDILEFSARVLVAARIEFPKRPTVRGVNRSSRYQDSARTGSRHGRIRRLETVLRGPSGVSTSKQRHFDFLSVPCGDSWYSLGAGQDKRRPRGFECFWRQLFWSFGSVVLTDFLWGIDDWKTASVSAPLSLSHRPNPHRFDQLQRVSVDAKSQRCPQGSYTSASCEESYLQSADTIDARLHCAELQKVVRTSAPSG
jgi:hypothetical protein